MTKKMTQNEMILLHLKQHGSITPLDALGAYGCFRLSGRIFELRSMGYDIETVNETKDGKTYARYFLKGELKENDG